MASGCSGPLDTGFVALGYGRVAVLGIVQGVTELLPISSTAHMRVVPALLGWPDPGLAFSAAMQLAAVVSYFRSDVLRLTAGSARAITDRRFDDPHLRLSAWILIATLPIGAAELLLSDVLDACGSPLGPVANSNGSTFTSR
ncbi:hypothetical protein G4G93_32180 [Methylobacterium sp. DB0501]|jgi:undecaprenyl-diphosphatase|nr:hypothetical protein [Methylobacterium sp. DB0501]